jgi:hypothetical protein
MGDALQVIGLVGGSIGALVCVVAAVGSFKSDNAGRGVGLLVLSPIAFLVGTFLTVAALVIGLITFMVWIWMLDN